MAFTPTQAAINVAIIVGSWIVFGIGAYFYFGTEDTGHGASGYWD